ncbi:MAG: EutN/CcmL family microcompartment protein [candidate division Zixibacteria bacterium]|nr:EutN/CcmL family microcompartment protein [candidate division Zixibacteria bacterium]
MFIGTVVGQLWSTKKVANLQSLRFLLIRPENLDKAPNTSVVVAADILGAGVGERVMVAYGRAARLAIGDENASIEAAVVAIIDNIDARLDTPSSR